MMKKLLARGTFTCIIIGLLTSGSIHKDSGGTLYRNFIPGIRNDTTGLISSIESDTFNLTILRPSSGIQFYRNGIVFLSLSKNEEKITPNHISFGTVEAYYAKPMDSVLGKHLVFSPSSSFSFPCDGISFSPDFNTMYFTKIPKKENKERIFKAKFTSDGKSQAGWVPETVPLDFCKDNYTYSHPTINTEENVIIFASDMVGSLGGMDLFITRKTGNSWSVPQNLGKSINTSGNEFFPFLDAYNNLFFSSDGLPGGYGGYDIYTCKFNGKVWDKPINLSSRINSTDDDIAFTINKVDGKSAFFTRRQKTAYGEMQLFRVTLNREFVGNDQLTISYVFHGKPLLTNSLLAANILTQDSQAKVEPAREEPVSTRQKNVAPEKETVSRPVKVKKVPKDKRKVLVVVPPVSVPPIPDLLVRKDPKIVLKTITSVINKNKDAAVYRVQILSSKTSKGTFQVTVNNKTYDTYEYFYLNEYRYTIGEFSTVASAVEFQNACRKDGKPLVFVVAFKNNLRSLDPSLFK